MSFSLDGRVAVVTGGARGIGRGIAGVYRQAGASVVIVDIDEQAAAGAARDLGDGVSAISADVTRKADHERVVQSVIAQHGRIDVLTHNVGIYPNRRITELTEADWDRVQAVNLKSLLFAVQAAVPAMRRQGGGRITVTSSITGPRVGYPGLSHYAASKAGVNGFIRSAALEFAADAITINGVEPGTVLTEGLRTHLSASDIDTMAADIPLGRLASPEDIAGAHLFLASDAAAYITGQTIVVDGGQILPETRL
jgi:3-oxoacyl-[acyl-carrier protein] reductase